MKVKVSAVISAYNEEKNISLCLKSLDWVDEIIMIDNSSFDKTAEIAKNLGAKVFQRPNFKMLNKNKNFGFDKSSNQWILNLDADERISSELKKEIIKTINHQPSTINNQSLVVNGYWVPRKNIIFNKWIKHSLWWPDYQLRLFRKGKGRFPEKHVHEKIEIQGRTEKLHNPIIHNNYRSVSQFIYKMNNIYTENESQILAKEELNWKDALFYPLDDFVKTFISKEGYKDGMHGLILSILQAFYSFVVFAKAWEKQGFKEMKVKQPLKEIDRAVNKFKKDSKYWIYQSKIDKSKTFFVKSWWRLIRKLFLR